ncbi:MAG TPA: dienelactone hydrolase family protein [Anaerolineales bacterium]
MTGLSTQPKTRMVNVPRAGSPARFMESYLALPEGPGPFPGLVVIHEIFGLNENIREIARRFAGQGYATLAIDLFSGQKRIACMLQIFHGIMFRPLDNRPLSDLLAALEYLRQQPEVSPSRVGAVGFCMGGSYALQLAIKDEHLRAASVFYGQNPKPLEAVARACPIVGSYPEKDFTAQAARELEPALERYNILHDIKIYPGARHSFFNDQGSAFDPTAAADAWERMLAFFQEHLGAKEAD